jgi:acyl-CoA hydrolase
MPNLTSAFSTQEEHANDKAFTFYQDSSIKANMHPATEPSSITNDLVTLNNKNQDYGMNTSDNGNSSVTHSTDKQASNEGKPETSESYYFDGLMNDASNKFPAMAMPVTLDEVPKNVEQDTNLKTASPTSHATGSPGSSTSRVVLSVKIETVDAGTQPLIIMEVCYRDTF